MSDQDRTQNNCNPQRNTDSNNAANGVSQTAFERITVLGIGNVLWADEGFGVRAVEVLQQRFAFSPDIQLLDGGTQGLLLIETVMDADALIILDAVDYGLEPGTLHLVEGEEVPKFLGAKKMSLHQTGFQEVLQLADLLGSYPQQVVLIGCQPQELDDFGGSLRPVVRQALEPAVAKAVEYLRQWGVQVQERPNELVDSDDAGLAALSIEAYEMGRPSAEMAFRLGDERFLVSAGVLSNRKSNDAKT